MKIRSVNLKVVCELSQCCMLDSRYSLVTVCYTDYKLQVHVLYNLYSYKPKYKYRQPD